MTTTIFIILGFLCVLLASQHFGKFASYFKLPLITGYLIAGAVVGPFVLGWISQDSVGSLRIIDQISLGFIAFAAGSELYLKEVRSRLKSIAWITAAQFIFTFSLGVGALLLIADHIPFMREMALETRFAVALMAAAILVARSPSSAIAIISELRARGPFTKSALGVTVVMDAVVILVFATSASVSLSLVGRGSFDLWCIIQVVLELIVSLNLGYTIGKVLQKLVSMKLNGWVKTLVILSFGLGVFWLSDSLHDFGEHYLNLPISLEPLLVCMVAGFVVTNHPPSREIFAKLLNQVAPIVYLVFFTLVGASLAIDALVRLWPVALALFVIRLIGIMMGSFAGGMIAGDKPQHVRLGWMVYVTQAGVGLGLAKNVSDDFPSFGTEFAAMIIAVIVLSQFVGPPLFKFAIKRVGESHLKAKARPDEIRNALILGIDNQSLAVARQLKEHNWEVIMADTDRSHVERLSLVDVDERYVEDFDEEAIKSLASSATDALVAMLEDDEANYRACELGYEKLGIPRIIVRLNNLSWSDKFQELGALVVEPSSAMVNLFDQFVRLPRLATLFLHRDPHHEVVQVTIADPDIVGLPLRDLRLPPTVRVLGITREGQSIVPYGFSVLEHNDEVTLVGEIGDVEKVASRWGY